MNFIHKNVHDNNLELDFVVQWLSFCGSMIIILSVEKEAQFETCPERANNLSHGSVTPGEANYIYVLWNLAW